MNWTGGWSGPRRIQKPDGTYKDELPQAGMLMLILGGVFCFFGGGVIGAGILVYSLTDRRSYSSTAEFYADPQNGPIFYQLLLLWFLGGGLLALGAWIATVWESRRMEKRRKERERRLSQKWGDG